MWNEFRLVLQETTIVSTVFRLFLALILGGILGLERGRKRRPAGLRTYMVVCVASSLIMLTGEYLYETTGGGDPARLGAQVISGIGFLGAGTIITNSHQVKGLTTAAGLWAAACLGLAVGAGFYCGAIAGGLAILVAMTTMSHLDSRLRTNARQMNFFAEFESMDSLGSFISMMRSNGYKLYDIEFSRSKRSVGDLVGVTFWVGFNAPVDHVQVIEKLSGFLGVKYLEEIEGM